MVVLVAVLSAVVIVAAAWACPSPRRRVRGVSPPRPETPRGGQAGVASPAEPVGVPGIVDPVDGDGMPLPATTSMAATSPGQPPVRPPEDALTLALAGGSDGDPPSPDSPVLSWRRIQLVSVLGDGTTAILACRRSASGPARLVRGRRGDRLRLCDDDRTLVLRLGTGEAAGRALGLLERWCSDGSWVRLRLSDAVGVVELRDDAGRSSLRASVAAA